MSSRRSKTEGKIKDKKLWVVAISLVLSCCRRVRSRSDGRLSWPTVTGAGTSLMAASSAGLSDVMARGLVGKAGHVPLGHAGCTSEG